MIIEGILTTENPDGSMHVSPIGPHVNPELSLWTLKPFQSSTTFTNLRCASRAVFHVVDDSLLMAAAVLGLCNEGEPYREVASAQFNQEIGWVLDLSCNFFALSVDQWDLSSPRAIAECSLVENREKRPFWGWNRAKHSILELSIVASRVHFLERQEIEEALNMHRVIIEKTAGPRELAAWELLKKHLT